MRRLWLFLCLLVLAAAPAAAQEGAPAAGSATIEAAQDGGTVADAAAPVVGGLPQSAPPPRTFRAYWHVFGAFALAWGFVFGYAIHLARRSGALEQQIKRLEGSGV